jgi:hypothetical protein
VNSGSMRSDDELKDFVRTWNKQHRVGTTVALRETHAVLGATRCKAYIMGVSPVVEIEGTPDREVFALEKLEVAK